MRKPGEFNLPKGGRKTILRRSVDLQTDHVLNLTTLDNTIELVGLGMISDLRQDTKAAIDELCNGDDVEALKRRLAAQIIQDDAVASHVTELALGLIQIKTDSAMEHAFSALRTASKLRDSSRKGLVALAEIKRPKKTTFIAKQQNLAVMQNEGDDRNLKTIEGTDYGRVDFGEKGSGKGTNEAGKTLVPEQRSKNKRGKSGLKSKQP